MGASTLRPTTASAIATFAVAAGLALPPFAARAADAAPSPGLVGSTAMSDLASSLPGLVVGVTGGAMLAAIVCGVLALHWRNRVLRAEERVEKSNTAIAEADALVDAAPDGLVFWAAREAVPRVSRSVAALVDVPAGDGGLLDWASIKARFLPDARAALEARLATLVADGAPFAERFTLADGRRLLVRGGVVRNGGGALGHALWLSDDSEIARRDADHAKALADIEARLDSVIETADKAPFPVWRRGPDLRLEWVNTAYARAVEAPLARVVAGEGIEFASRAVGPRARELAADALKRDEVAREKRFVVVDGQRRAFDIIEVPLSDRRTVGFAIDVTALDEARTDLARHIDGHAETLDRLGTAIAIFGPDKRLGYYNSAYAKLWGIDEEWLDGQPHDSEVLERLRESRLLPEQADFPAWKRQRLTLYTAVIEPREEFWYLPDGRTLREVCQPHPFGGLLFFYEDVTDRLALERSHNTLIAVQGATLDKLYEGVAVFGSDGRMRLSNPAYAKIWKLDVAALEGEPHIADIVDLTRDLLTEEAEEWPHVRAHMIQIVTEREARSGRMERPDGSVIDFAASHLPDGAMLLAYLDVTDSTRIERALRERNEALETADQLKTDFISNVSYELRTPLNTIIGFGEILDQEYFGTLNPRQHEYSQGILHSSSQLLNLVNDILDLATIEAGAMTLERSRVIILPVLQNVAQLMAEQGRKHQLSIDVDCALPPGDAIEADERRLKQVLVNLVSNAIKYTLPGGSITLGASRDNYGVSLWVADNGIGIDPRLHETVFEKFETAGERRRGAGLGLSLVRSFIELHGGEVRLESVPGSGTRVICRLPLSTLDDAAPAPSAATG